MSYNPTNWTSGDIITSEKLNKIEQGIADAAENSNNNNVFLVNVDNQGICDKTAYEIKTAVLTGKQVVFISTEQQAV